MKSYIVDVTLSDLITVEANSNAEAQEAALEIALQSPGTLLREAQIIHSSDVVEEEI